MKFDVLTDCPCRSSILITRSASGKGNGRSSTAFTTLKMRVVAPMPNARANAAVNVNPGCAASPRRPTRNILKHFFLQSSWL